MQYPLVSFAILCYKQEGYIKNAIEGALRQDYPNLEIYISDDCSPDGTFEVVKEVVSAYTGPHQIRLNQNSKNRGIAAHVNFILSQLRGDFICWNAGDDIPLPAKVSKLIAPMLEDEQIMGVDSAVQEIDLDGNITGGRYKPPFDYDATSLEQMIRQGYSVRSQSHAFRRKVYETFGVFESFMTNEGRPQAVREKLLGRIVFIEEPLTLYRVGSGISTYTGKEIHKLTFSEPLKILGWHLTSLLQIQKDLDRAQGLVSPEEERALRTLLKREIKRAMIRKEVIEQPWNFKGLWHAWTQGSMAKRGSLDFIKRNMPKSLLKRLYRL